MADTYFSPRGAGVLLFDEDFDLPRRSAPSLDPEVIEPLFTLAELKAACDEAALESREAALLEAKGHILAATGQALGSIAEQIAATRAELTSMAEQSSEAIVRLLLGCFATVFPALAARHGAGETAAILREILPALHHEPKITIRISPHIAASMAREIQALDGDLAAHVRLVPTDAMAPGDARITWENGAATRDAASLWSQIEAILAPAGLLNTTGPLNAEHTAKDYALVE
jgi:flagellar biosynthesis/type III secretory pathway protein FliH